MYLHMSKPQNEEKYLDSLAFANKGIAVDK